jgi:hypothetical protein
MCVLNSQLHPDVMDLMPTKAAPIIPNKKSNFKSSHHDEDSSAILPAAIRTSFYYSIE